MAKHDAYAPVAIEQIRNADSDRPYYIYATSVVMLVWAGVFIYLRTNYQLSEDDGVISLSQTANFARRVIEINVGTIVVAVVASVLAVNAALWVVRKICKANQSARAERS